MPRQMNFARAHEMADKYRAGKTLHEIGVQYGVTRERVRQMLVLVHVTADEGGQSMRTFARIANQLRNKKPVKWESTANMIYGLSRDELRELNGGVNVSVRGTPAFRYKEQRKNAHHRGIAWEITFPEWLAIWKESGHFHERGPGKGYCMARWGDSGAYRADNVYITTIGGNFSDSYIVNTSADRRRKAMATRRMAA